MRKSSISIVMLGYALWVLFPFLYLFVLSLSSDWRFPDLLPNTLGLMNWAAVLGGETGLAKSFFLSLYISILVAISSTLTGFFLSRVINYNKRKDLWTIISYFPYVLAPVVFGACLSYYFIRLGLLGTTFGVILAQFFIAFPYAVIFFSPFWTEKTKDYENLVATLGGSPLQKFTRVLFPLSKNMLLICFFQTFLISWFEYGLSSIIGVGKVQTLTIQVFLFIKESNFYYGAMSCCLLMLPPIIFIYLNKKYVFNKIL